MVQTLKTLAHTHNKTIICTIHQPSSATFQLFDKVLFLAAGKTMYFGPVSEVVNHFAALGYTWYVQCNGVMMAEQMVLVTMMVNVIVIIGWYVTVSHDGDHFHSPTFGNPAEYVMDLINKDFDTSVDLDAFASKYKSSALAIKYAGEIEEDQSQKKSMYRP